jgi:hypothetical protein
MINSELSVSLASIFDDHHENFEVDRKSNVLYKGKRIGHLRVFMQTIGGRKVKQAVIVPGGMKELLKSGLITKDTAESFDVFRRNRFRNQLIIIGLRVIDKLLWIGVVCAFVALAKFMWST